MTAKLSWNRQNNTLYFEGELSAQTFFPLWQERHRVVDDINVIDVTGINRVDTAGLALLIHLQADIGKQGKHAVIRGMSDNLHTLAALYHLSDSLLPIAED